MSECPCCHEDGDYHCDNTLTSVFFCRNMDCRVATFDHIPASAGERGQHG